MTDKRRTAWAITGSGHYLKECLTLAEQLPDVDLFLSKAAAEVLQVYGFPIKTLKQRFKIFHDSTASAPPVGLFYEGIYEQLIVAPATSNSVAKMVCGISDSLVTNIYAQAGKCRIPSIVFACDAAPEMETEAPGGTVMVYPRRIDLENTQRLMDFEYTQVVTSLQSLKDAIGMPALCQNISSF
ncbi:MAG: flavoprotein [Sedimenticola sp.]|nr:flavoprotein [Sedimenticola sp.]